MFLKMLLLMLLLRSCLCHPSVWVITLGIHTMKLLACCNSGIAAGVWFYWNSCLPAPSCLYHSTSIFETSM